MIEIDSALLKEVAPHVTGKKAQSQATIIDALGSVMTADLNLPKYDLSSRLRIAHFIAQTCHESDGYCTTTEYASGREYEGRRDLGNTQPGDGPLFKGRGILQITGRANYKQYGDALGLDLIANPALAADPRTSVLTACEYWTIRKINAAADNDDLITVTKKVNGGLNGLESRRAYLVAAKQALVRVQAVATPAAAAAAPGQPTLVLRRGSKGEAVANLQAKLRAAGYPLAIDGDFGAATELAVMHFQQAKGLQADGIAGPITLGALG
jgi:putative chitinase